MRAFSAITQTFELCFPGGFFFCLPEFYFSVALLWIREDDEECKRREGFPSWSWLGSETRPYFDICDLLLRSFADTHYGIHLFVPKHFSGRHEPMVQWYKTDVTRYISTPIKESYHKWQSYANNHNLNLPPEWSRAKSGSQYDKSTIVYVYEGSGTTFPSGYEHRHPIPLQMDDMDSQLRAVRDWLPQLRGNVESSKVRLGKPSSLKRSAFAALSYNGQPCGMLIADQYEPEVHRLGAECVVFAVTKGVTTPSWLENMLKSVDITTTRSMDSELILGLWISWQGFLAYRQGLCIMTARDWNRMEHCRIDIVLG